MVYLPIDTLLGDLSHWTTLLPVLGVMFTAIGAGSSSLISSLILGASAAGSFAGGVGSLVKSFEGSPDIPQAVPPRISPAKGAFEQEAIEFLADIYQQVFAQLGFTYNQRGQLTYTPTILQQQHQSQAVTFAQRDEMRAMGIEVPTYGTPMTLEELTAQYDELKRRRDALAQHLMGGTPVPIIPPGSAPLPIQPTEIGPFADVDLPVQEAPPLPPPVGPFDEENLSINPDPLLMRRTRGI